jgi:polyketide synthase-associated protein
VQIDGAVGQLIQSGQVVLTDGRIVDTAGKDLQIPEKPGFDVLVGPLLNIDLLAEEASKCLFSKGYCILQLCEESSKTEEAVASMQELHNIEKLMRLPAEVEEGYLGIGAKGRVAWLKDDLEVSESIKTSDNFLTSLAYAMLPYSSDALGGIAEQRTPALLSLWLSDSDLAEYPVPFPDDQVLGTYLNTHHRGLLKAMRFMGPDTASVILSSKEDAALPCPPNGVQIDATRNTIVLLRPKCLEVAVSGSEYLVSTVTFMESESTPQIVGRWDVASALDTLPFTGASRPAFECCSIANLSTRLHASWDDPDYYRAGLTGGCDAAIEFQKSRFEWDAYYAGPDPTVAQPWQMCTKHMSYAEGIDLFDNKYFNIPAGDSLQMDPMQRMLLETGAMNLYQMGITKKFADRNPHHGGCGVGLDKDDWAFVPDKTDGGATPNVQAIISNRFSFVFNLKGANFVGDTACSASLACTHVAKKLMEDRKYDVLDFFVICGLHQCLSIANWMGSHLGHMFSLTARCQTFNETADGYMRGDGCSGLTLKWETPPEDKDVKVLGTMVGQNGRSATLTAPNGVAQEDVIWKCIRAAGAEPCEAAVWSCHGTGTSLGDPIEVGGVRKVMTKTTRATPLVVNSNKPNCGHLEGGAAMTSLLAACFQLQHCKANAIIHLGVLNPHLEGNDFGGFYSTENTFLNAHQGNAHISSFGFGGTNCHAVFWGENASVNAGDSQKFMKRLSMMAAPVVSPNGKDPSEWETDGLEYVANDGDTYSVTITKDDAVDKPIKYVLEQEALGLDFDPNDTSYDICFNNGEQLTMESGDVPGLRSVILEVPLGGEIEFNFVKTMEEDFVLAPAVNRCRRKTSPISGPAEGLTNKWAIAGVPGSLMRIDLFTSRGMMALSWLPAEL